MSNKGTIERLERERIRRECLFLAGHAGKMASLVRQHRERLGGMALVAMVLGVISMSEHRTSDPKAGVVLGRFAAILHALDEFYELKEALLWCESPQLLLAGRRPIELLATDQGAIEVAAVIARLRDGAFI